MKLQGKEQDYY